MQPQHTVRLIHWKESEGDERRALLQAAGFTVLPGPVDAASGWSRPPLPDAFVIDLSRLPSHGKAVALSLRQSRRTHCIPILFVGGTPEKMAAIRKDLPDAIGTTWSRISSGLHRALRAPVKTPLVPKSDSGAYSGTPLPRKLGIKSGMNVVVLDPPAHFERTLGDVPDGVQWARQNRGSADLTLWFVTSEKSLSARIDRLVTRLRAGDGLWICWPKKSSGQETDLSDAVVRRIALAAGIVDYKVCAIDNVWSGLKFSLRKANK